MSYPLPRLSRAPRRVPFTLSTRVVLGGFLTQFGDYVSEGESVVVEYLRSDASISRIGGMHERLVYDPWNPSYTAVLDALPGRPRVNSEGEFETDGAYEPLMALLSLVIPTGTLLGHSCYLLSIY